MKTLLLSVSLGIIFLGTYLYFYLGAFKDVHVYLAEVPPFHILYKKHIGPYHKINEVILSVEQWTQKHNLPCSQSFGEYLDKPGEVDEDRLQSHGGCLTPKTDVQLPEGFFQRTVEANKYISAEFSGSPAIGPFVVYPKLEKFAIKARLETQSKSFEIYQTQGSDQITTRYLIPLRQVKDHNGS